MMDSPLPNTAAEAADSQPATGGPMGLAAVPGSAICGHCGQRRDKHYFEREIYCFENTNGDLWTAEPGWENISAMIEDEYPVLWKEMVAKWKEDNGHVPQNAEAQTRATINPHDTMNPPKSQQPPNLAGGASADATCSPELAGLIDRLDEARRKALCHTDSDIPDVRERWFGKASAFQEAADMARQCLENA